MGTPKPRSKLTVNGRKYEGDELVLFDLTPMFHRGRIDAPTIKSCSGHRAFFGGSRRPLAEVVSDSAYTACPRCFPGGPDA